MLRSWLPSLGEAPEKAMSFSRVYELDPEWKRENEKNVRTVTDKMSDKGTLDISLFTLQDAYDIILVSQGTVKTDKLSWVDMTRIHNIYPDPENPGMYQIFDCEADFNEYGGEAH